MRSINVLIFVCGCLGLLWMPPAQADDYSIEDVPSWVAPLDVSYLLNERQPPGSGAVDYLLVDYQWRVSGQETRAFRHFMFRAVNPSGVREISRVSIDFDPLYQKLILHKLVIHRDGKVLDRMSRSMKSVIQQEKDLEQQIYDGSRTLNMLLEDVRQGDVVEYSFTVVGENPVLKGHFSRRLDFQWSVPVAMAHYRLLWPARRSLWMKSLNGDMSPIEKTEGDYKVYQWRRTRIPALEMDGNTPAWYDPYPSVYLSDYGRWQDVRDWAMPMYTPQVSDRIRQEIVAPIMKTASTPEQRLLEALHFVQDQVRYLGIEMGERSHAPSKPDKVLDRRFGDCKDKSRLLVSVLSALDIEAYPALVSTTGGRSLDQLLPSPAWFDHVIVLARLNGRNYWLDPTLTYQKGTLDTLYMPDYGKVLVIGEPYAGLVNMSPDVDAVRRKRAVELFDVSGALGRSLYKSITYYEGYYADRFRASLADSDLKTLQKNFLNYLSRIYPRIKLKTELRVKDDPERNRISLIESYVIPGLWETSEDGKQVEARFQPFLIYDHVKPVEYRQRTMPYAVEHPVEYHQRTRIRLPPGSSLDDGFEEVKDGAFIFSKKVRMKGGELVIDYHYRSLKDHVPAEDIRRYAANVDKVRELAYHGLTSEVVEQDLMEGLVELGEEFWQQASSYLRKQAR
ncbi:DUF3857 domain-containing transglutaminase family protein [Thiolapillus sp.]